MTEAEFGRQDKRSTDAFLSSTSIFSADQTRLMEPDHQSTGVVGPATDVPFETLWKALVDKVRNPGKYLKGVKSVDSHDNDDGSVAREMSLENGAVMKENIYMFKDKKRIEFRVIDKPLVVVNQYLPDKKAIEYVLESPDGTVLGWFKGGREGTLEAIKGQYDKSKAL